MGVWVELWRKLSAEELMLLNSGVGEDSWVPWTARRFNQSILKEFSSGCSLEGLMLKLKLQYFGHLMRGVDSWLLILGGIGGRGRRGWQRMRWLDGTIALMEWVWVDSRSWWWTGRPRMLRFMGLQRVKHKWETELNCRTVKVIFSNHGSEEISFLIKAFWRYLRALTIKLKLLTVINKA